MSSLFGQRGFTLVVTGVITILLMFLSAAAGNDPGTLPVDASGNVITAEGILQKFLPGVMVVLSLVFTMRTITNKVNAGEYDPGNLSALFKSREFWVQLFATVMAGIEMAGLRFWTADQQASMVDLILNLLAAGGVIAAQAYSVRPNGLRASSAPQTGMPVYFKNFVGEKKEVA